MELDLIWQDSIDPSLTLRAVTALVGSGKVHIGRHFDTLAIGFKTVLQFSGSSLREQPEVQPFRLPTALELVVR